MKAKLNRNIIYQPDKEETRLAILKLAAMAIQRTDDWGGSGSRIPDLIGKSMARLEKYDKLFPGNTSLEASYLEERCRASNISFPKRQGSGKKYEYHDDHDIPVMSMLITLHDDYGFREQRLNRFFHAIEEEIRYYNRAFLKDDRKCMPTVMAVIDNKLQRNGCDFFDKNDGAYCETARHFDTQRYDARKPSENGEQSRSGGSQTPGRSLFEMHEKEVFGIKKMLRENGMGWRRE